MTEPTNPPRSVRAAWDNPNLNLENLDLLIAHMQQLPRRAFNMSNWVVRNHNTGDRKDPTPTEALAIVQTQAKTGPDHKGKPVCGTVACIAGEATLLSMAQAEQQGTPSQVTNHLFMAGINYERSGRVWIGLDEENAHQLFVPPHAELSRIKKNTAIRVLQYLRETGTVTWKVPRAWNPTYIPFVTETPFLVKDIPEPEMA